MILQVRVSGCEDRRVSKNSVMSSKWIRYPPLLPRGCYVLKERTSEDSTFSKDSGSKPCALYKFLRFSHVQFEILNFRIHHFYPSLSSRIITLVFQKPSRTYQIRRCLEHLETLLKRCLGVRTLPSKERLEDYRKFYPYFCAVFLIHRSHLFTPGSLTYPVQGTRANIG